MSHGSSQIPSSRGACDAAIQQLSLRGLFGSFYQGGQLRSGVLARGGSMDYIVSMKFEWDELKVKRVSRPVVLTLSMLRSFLQTPIE